MSITLYHNPRCSKSRQTLALLEEKGIQPDIIEYLQSPPDAATLTEILAALGITAENLMRKGEDEFKSDKDSVLSMSEQQQIEWLAANPKVIERPIVVNGEQARIGRPPESVLEII